MKAIDFDQQILGITAPRTLWFCHPQVVGLAVFEEDVARAKEEIRQDQVKRLDSDAFPVSQR